MKDWKSTAVGVLSFLAVTFVTITAFLSPYLLLAPFSEQALLVKISAGLALGAALTRAWIGIITNNADAAATAQAINSTSAPAAPTISMASIANTPAVKAVALLLIFGTSAMLLTGCTDWERLTFQTLNASQAVINQAQTDYEARTIAKTPAAYAAINEAKAAQTLAVQAMVTYEEVKAAKGTQSALDAQQAIVTTSLERLPVLIDAIKGMIPVKKPAAAPIAMSTWNLPIAA